MNFERIAQKSYERGDYVRTIVVLSRGLKRAPDVDNTAFDLLINTYANHCHGPGLEDEVCDIVARHFDSGIVSAQIIVALEDRQMNSMARMFRRAIERRGVLVEEVNIWPVEHEEEPHEVDDVEALDTDAAALLGRLLDSADELAEHDVEPEALEQEEDPSEDDTSADDEVPGEPVVPPQEVEEGAAEEDEPGDERAPEEDPEGQREDAVEDELEADDELEGEPGEAGVDESEFDFDDEPELQEETTTERLRSLREERAEAGGSRNWLLIAAAVVLVVALAGFAMSRGTHLEAIDSQLVVFDTLNTRAFEQTLIRLDEVGGEGSERADFIRMLLALEAGQVEPLDTQRREHEELGSWGRAALVMGALQRRDFEAATMHVEALERLASGELCTLWSRARLEEERGEFDTAQEVYERALADHPHFLSGMMGLMRLAYRRGDQRALVDAAARLRALNPLHVYLRLEDAAPLDVERDFLGLEAPGEALEELEIGGAPDRFLRAYKEHSRAREAWRRGDIKTARAATRDALSLEPHMGPALLMQGAVLAADLEAEEAGKSFARYARLDGLDVEGRLGLLLVAPRALTEAGRPELALIFTISPAGEAMHKTRVEELSEQIGTRYEMWRPVELSLTREQLDMFPGLERDALYELARVLLELGDTKGSVEALSLLSQRGKLEPRARLLRAVAFFVSGQRERLDDVAYQLRGEPEEAMARALIALSQGRWDEAVRESAADITTLQRHPYWLRIRASSLLGAGRAEDVLGLLDGARLASTYRGAESRLRLRAWSRLDASGEHTVSLGERLDARNVTGLHARIDAGAARLWRGQRERAGTQLGAALELAPKHPEASWFAGLLQHQLGNSRGAREHLEILGVEDIDDARILLVLAEIYQSLGNYERAHQMYNKVVLAERKNTRALRGMGQVFVAWNRQLGLREFDRMVKNYEGIDGSRSQAAEVLKWLAVLDGSRRGRVEAFDYITRAIAQVGPRGDLLVEKAHYYKATSQDARARRTYVAALRQDSTLAPAHLGLAKLAIAANEPRSARDHLIKYTELEPYGADTTWARTELEKLGQTLQKQTSAENKKGGRK